GIIVAAVVVVGLLIWGVMRLAGGGGDDTSAAIPAATATTPAGELSTPEVTTPSAPSEPDGGIIIIIPTPEAGKPTVIAISPTNIRGGPSQEYPVIGLLNQGEAAEAIGISEDGQWYAIRIPSSPQGSGWVFAQLMTGSDVDNLPIIAAPPLPEPTAAPPVVITDWEGQYFNNRDLQGDPVLVRNDAVIDFNWGTGSPAPEVQPDNFSARWTIQRNAPAGVYRFSVWVDDGVRVFVDDQLIINGWSEGPARNYTAEIEVEDGSHKVVVEYFESTGTALISLNVGYQGPAVTQPPAARINGPTRGLVGEQLTYDGTSSRAAEGSEIVNYQWTFSDGAVSTGDRVTHVYAQPGVYNVTLVVVDDKGLSGTATIQVRIDPVEPAATPTPTQTPTPEVTVPPAPVPGFTIAPEQRPAGQPVQFDASQSVASAPIVNYVWDFGDGTTGQGVQTEHVFATAGTYQVTLQVTDENGQSAASTLPVLIGEAGAAPTVAPTVAPTEEVAPTPTAEGGAADGGSAETPPVEDGAQPTAPAEGEATPTPAA
ncbi:MAG: PKD domain-containing protein, partial [Caldilineaceae bacterium]|nr:PKD domain-containing protein [Caldilineaceae bacterium]